MNLLLRYVALLHLATAVGCGVLTLNQGQDASDITPQAPAGPSPEDGGNGGAGPTPLPPVDEPNTDALEPDAALPASPNGSPNTSVAITSRLDPRACVGLVGSSGGNVGTWTCSHDSPVGFTYTSGGQFRHVAEGLCLTAAPSVNGVIYVEKAVCNAADGAQQWTYDGNRLRNAATGRCLDLVTGRTQQRSPLQLAGCTTSDSQGWYPPLDLSVTVNPLQQATTVRGRCRPAIYVDDVAAVADANRKLFWQKYPNLVTQIGQAVADAGNVLFASPNDVPTSRVYLHVQLTDDASVVADASDYSIRLGVKFFVDQYNKNIPNDIDGALRHEFTHFYQAGNRGTLDGTPGWLIEGMAEYVRIVTGFAAMSDRAKGGYYTDSYRPTGFFLLYLDQTYKGLMRRLIQYLVEHGDTASYSDSWFTQQTGKTLNALWKDYQASF